MRVGVFDQHFFSGALNQDFCICIGNIPLRRRKRPGKLRASGLETGEAIRKLDTLAVVTGGPEEYGNAQASRAWILSKGQRNDNHLTN